MKSAEPVALRHLTQCLDGRRIPLNSAERHDIPGEIPYWGSGGVVGTVGEYLFNEPLVLLGEDGAPFYDRNRDVAFKVSGKTWVNNHIHVLRPNADVDHAFLTYALNSVDYSLYISGSTRDKLTQEDMRRIMVPMWQLERQRQIALLLDRETAQIDELIGKQERLIELLTEKRQAVVSDYIADVIQPTSRDSGMRLKHLYNVIDERANGADLPLMSVSIHRGLQRRDETTDDEPRADDLSNYKVCRAGDLVINRMRAFQGALGYSAESGLISPDYLVLRPHRTVDSGWLSAVLRSHWAIGQMRSRLRGIGSVEQGVVRTPRINASDLGEIRIRVPSTTAQRSFLDHNQDVTQRLDLLANKASAAVHLLRERRSAIISAAVTGKIDLREGAA